MEIIEVNNEKFVVLRKVDLEKFNSDENRDKFFQGKLWLRQQNSNMAYIVNKTIEASFIDIPNEVEPQVITPEPEPAISYAEAAYTGSLNNQTGQTIDIKI